MKYTRLTRLASLLLTYYLFAGRTALFSQVTHRPVGTQPNAEQQSVQTTVKDNFEYLLLDDDHSSNETAKQSVIDQVINIGAEGASGLEHGCFSVGKAADAGVGKLTPSHPLIHNCLSQVGHFCQICKFSYVIDENGRHCVLKSNGKLRFPTGEYLSPVYHPNSQQSGIQTNSDLNELIFIGSEDLFEIMTTDFTKTLTVADETLVWKSLHEAGLEVQRQFSLHFDECGGFTMLHPHSGLYVVSPGKLNSTPTCLDIEYA